MPSRVARKEMIGIITKKMQQIETVHTINLRARGGRHTVSRVREDQEAEAEPHVSHSRCAPPHLPAR